MVTFASSWASNAASYFSITEGTSAGSGQVKTRGWGASFQKWGVYCPHGDPFVRPTSYGPPLPLGLNLN